MISVSEVKGSDYNGCVFLVDDDIDDQFLFGEALQSLGNGLSVVYAANGADALEKLKQMEKPSIIFTDLNMPKLNGLEFLQRLKQMDALKDVPVIAYSTSSGRQHIDAMLVAGAVHYMIKHESYALLCQDLKFVLSRFML